MVILAAERSGIDAAGSEGQGVAVALTPFPLPRWSGGATRTAQWRQPAVGQSAVSVR